MLAPHPTPAVTSMQHKRAASHNLVVNWSIPGQLIDQPPCGSGGGQWSPLKGAIDHLPHSPMPLATNLPTKTSRCPPAAISHVVPEAAQKSTRLCRGRSLAPEQPIQTVQE